MSGERGCKYYTRREVRKLSGVNDTTLDRWSRRLRDTDMVKKAAGRVFFTQDFVDFVATRVESQGPAGLPEPERIAALMRLWRERSSIQAVAEALDSNPVLIEAQLMAIGVLDYD